MKIYCILLISLLSTISSYGGAQQWNVWLSKSGNTGPPQYQIPSGKVFILEAVLQSGTGQTETKIAVMRKADNVNFSAKQTLIIKDSFNSYDTVFLPHKIRLKAGETLHIPYVANGSLSRVRYFGLLIDKEDLYAANMPVELDNARIVGAKLMADAKVKSGRPHKITVESSPDMTGFTEDESAEVAAAGSAGTSVVSVEKGSTDKKFIRISAQSRPRK